MTLTAECGDCLKVIKELPLSREHSLPSVENRSLTDKDEIEKALSMGEYIKKGTLSLCPKYPDHVLNSLIETLALYSLRKYRHLKKMYPDSMSDP